MYVWKHMADPVNGILEGEKLDILDQTWSFWGFWSKQKRAISRARVHRFGPDFMLSWGFRGRRI